MPGAIHKAQELQSNHPGSYFPNQFDNPANPDEHRGIHSTDRKQSGVATAETGGTITDRREALKLKLPNLWEQ